MNRAWSPTRRWPERYLPVGDKVDITWTEAAIVSLEDAK
jgi:hypothetical protein